MAEEKGVAEAVAEEVAPPANTPGLGVRCLRDALPLLQASGSVAWPELLRLVICHWCEQAEEGKQVEPPADAMSELAAHLARQEYRLASPSLKARALHALWERLLCAPPTLPGESLEALDKLSKDHSHSAAALRQARKEDTAYEPAPGATPRQQQLGRASVVDAVRQATEALEAAQQEERERAPLLRDAVRLCSLGKDRQGATYWLLSEPPTLTSTAASRDGADAGGADTGARGAAADVEHVPGAYLFAESSDGAWGVIDDVVRLAATLLPSDDARDRALLQRLQQATLCDLPTPSGVAPAAPADDLCVSDCVSVETRVWGEAWARYVHGDEKWRSGRTYGLVLERDGDCCERAAAPERHASSRRTN